LLIQGSHEYATPVKTTHAFYRKLLEAGVSAIHVVYPWTDHGFDLLLSATSPAAHSALYDVDRFLALLLNDD
jgi:acetyl esterase/lipase